MHKLMNKAARAALALAVLAGLVSCGPGKGPTKSVAMTNQGDFPVSVTFQVMKDDGSYDAAYLIDKDLGAWETVYEAVPEGTYLVSAWDMNDNEIRSIEGYKVSLPDGKDDVYPAWLDAHGGNDWALVNVDFIYEGQSEVADQLAEAAGAAEDQAVLEDLFDGSEIFSIDPKYYGESFVYPGDKLPEEVAAGSTVYVLVPVTADIDDEVALSDEIYTKIYELVEE